MIFGARRYGNIITDGLVLNLDATNPDSYPGSGTTWYDTSFARNSGTLTNGPTFLQERGRGSIVFDGADDYVIVNDNSTLRGFTGLTISAWVNKKTKDIKIVGKWTGGQNYILRETSGVLQFYTNTSTSVGGGIGINPSSGWKLYTATWDGNTMRAYLNTTVSATTYNQTGTIINAGSNLIIGAEYDITFNSDASISNVQIYNRALSALEVQQNYNALKSRFGL